MTIARLVFPVLFLACLMAPDFARADENFYPVTPGAMEEIAPPPAAPPGRVILLHGIARTSLSMAPIANELQKRGYEVYNIGYNSTRDTLATIVRDFVSRNKLKLDETATPLHFVCYSLGCLVTRGIIQQHRPANLGRVVMLGPPNQGSEMADWMAEHAASNFLLGPNLPQLGTANRRMLEKLIGNKVDYETGIIAGNEALDPVGPGIIPGEDDGRVSVERTKIEGMKAHLVVGVSHTGLLMSDVVQSEMLFFLEHGDFHYE